MISIFENQAKRLNTAGTSGAVSVPVYQLPGFNQNVASEFRGPTLLIVDRTVKDSAAITSLKALLDETPFVYSVESGEHVKSISEFSKLTAGLREIFANKFRPPSTVVAVGGGTLINFANAAMAHLTGRTQLLPEQERAPAKFNHYLVLPSTILAVADVALGSKGNINSSETEHRYRSYFEPDAILLDKSILSSLPVSEIKRGLVECLKHSILQDDGFGIGAPRLGYVLGMLTQPNPPSDLAFTLGCLTMYAKAAVLGRDAFETSWKGGLLLSYGHLHAHAWESASRFSVAHGDSVLFGMLVDLKLNGNPDLYRTILSVVPFTPLKDSIFQHPPQRASLTSAYAAETKPFFLGANGSFRILGVPERGAYQAPILDRCSVEPSRSFSLDQILNAVDRVVADIKGEITKEGNRSWLDRWRNPDELAYVDLCD